MKRIRIAIAEDQELFRKSLIALLITEKWVNVVVDSNNGTEFLKKIKELDVPPDISLIDLNLPGLNGFELTEALQKDFPDMRVIILSVHSHDHTIARAIQLGASGYVSKSCDADELFTTLLKVHEQGIYLTRDILKSVMQASRHQSVGPHFSGSPVTLTKRERQVLGLVCKEYSNVEIANMLYISIRTVEGHRTNLLQKTGCKGATGLALFAVKYNLIDII